MLDDKKSDTFSELPKKYCPKTYLVTEIQEIKSLLDTGKLALPIILKPDVGHKGHLVEKVMNWNQIDFAFEKLKGQKIIAQQFIDYCREFSLMFYRFPHTGICGISSFIEKSYPTIIGDGKSTIKALILDLRNPFLQKENLISKGSEDFLNTIPALNEEVVIEKIGNYSRGAKFHARLGVIDQTMIDLIDDIFKSLKGMNFFRMDFKADSIKDFKEKKFKILEINGAKSEPLHIYDDEMSIVSIVRDIHRHWMIMIKIIKQVKSKDYIFPPTKVGWDSFRVAYKIGK